jgi:oligopeptide transport system substrate-binding protein
MKARRLTALIALPVAVAVGVSACGTGGSTSNTGSAGGTVTIGIAEPEHLVPSNTVEANGFQVTTAL